KLLRLDEFARGTTDKVTVEERLKRREVPLSKHIDAIAHLVHFFGLGYADFDKMWCICYELIRGWELKADTQDWAASATAFAHALCKRKIEPTKLSDQATIMAAFTSAVQWSLGVANLRYKPVEIAKMQRKAGRIGLGDPKDIVARELTKAQKALQAFTAGTLRLPGVSRTQREVVAVEAGESEDEIVVTSEEVVMSEDAIGDVIRVGGDDEVIVYGSESEDEFSH
ncbi:hypothetical protein LTR95_011073, partial [Oleoguttula sp. CCFEE 5521]